MANERIWRRNEETCSKIDRKASFLHYHPETSIWQVEIKLTTVCQLVIHQNTSKRGRNISSASLFRLQNCDVHSNWDAGRMSKIRSCFIRDFFRGLPLFRKYNFSHFQYPSPAAAGYSPKYKQQINENLSVVSILPF